MIKFLSILILFLTFSLPIRAEMEKTANTCDNKICFQWWPVLPKIEGWHQELGSSKKYSFNAIAPDGYNFSNANAVMYAKASYKPRIPETKTLEMFITDDKKTFLESDPQNSVSETEAIVTKSGQKLRSFTFFPKDKGNWEKVSYGEEGDFYIIFVISSRDKAGYQKNLPAYESLIQSYKE